MVLAKDELDGDRPDTADAAGSAAIGERIRARIAATGADIVVLPFRVDQHTGKSVYSQENVLIVKRLKAEGINATFLDDRDDRVFESLNSAELVLGATLALGLATNLAYDVLKLAVKRMWRRTGPETPLSVRITDATQSTPAEWTLSGSSTDVLNMLEQLQERQLLPSEPHPDKPAGVALDAPAKPSPHVIESVRKRLSAAEELRVEAQTLLDRSPDNLDEAEVKAVEALAAYRSALDWAEDTDHREEVHLKLDAAGRWRRDQFRCAVDYSEGKYWETCPVALGHRRVGLSVGGVACRSCSICGLDFTECEHDPERTYLVPGGTAVANYCCICAAPDCSTHKTHLMYEASPIAIITEMHVDEISLVARPAFKDARIQREELLASELPLVNGRSAPAGAPLTCNKCLSDCGGLIEMPGRI